MDEFTLTLNSPITEEQWDMITDVDFDRTNEVTFHTKHGKQVVFVKRKKGKWKPIDRTWGRSFYVCSVCSDPVDVPTVIDKPSYRFCPWCGADMKEGQHETD